MFDYGVGIRNPLFFVGVIENNNDPRKEGRVKVRAFGVHGTNKQIEEEQLPWAIVIQGDYNPENIPRLNSWVFGMFIDGRTAQQPMVLGLIPTQHTELIDPALSGWGTIPLSDADILSKGSTPADIGQPQNSRLARAENIEETYVVDQNAMRAEGVEFAGDPEKTWSEPAPAYNATYPHNKVIETGKHVIELDDSPGQERIMIYHKEGSYYQVDNRGTVTNKAASDQMDVIDRNHHIVVGHDAGGFQTVTINGNSYVKVNGNKIEEITGNLETIVHGNHHLSVGQQSTIQAGNQMQLRAPDVRAEANVGTFSIKAGKEMQIGAGQIIYVKSEKINMQGTDDVNIKGNNIFAQALIEMNILGDDVYITGTEDANLYGKTLQVGADGKLSIDADKVCIDDEISMANGDAIAADTAEEALDADEPLSVEAPEPTTPSMSVNPVERGSMGSTGITSQDDTSVVSNAAFNADEPIDSVTEGVLGPLLDYIHSIESQKYGYDSLNYLMYNAGTRPPKPITQMTMDELLAWQFEVDPLQGSEAVGRYQIIEDTLRGYDSGNNSPKSKNYRGQPYPRPAGTKSLYEAAGLSGSDLFNAANQDKLCIELIKRCGLKRFLNNQLASEQVDAAGNVTVTLEEANINAFANKLAGTWAAIPIVTGANAGKSSYEGDAAGNSANNSAGKGVDGIKRVLRELKANEAAIREEYITSASGG